MKKLNQKSYIDHNKQYESTSDLSWHIKEYEKSDSIKLFEVMGFRKVFEDASKRIRTHIDIGCGGGYLVDKACNFFDYVYGIEPSLAAIRIAKVITKDNAKIKFINDGMVDGIQKIDLKGSPFLLTTSAVLSHIDNDHVDAFLDLLNKVAIEGSRLYFYEPYDKNIDIDLWHVRNKSWWLKRLPNWQIHFLDIQDCGYKKGIEGIYLGAGHQKIIEENCSPFFILMQNLLWTFSGKYYKLRYAISRFIKQR